jgi:hypothetical protein
MVIKTGLFLSHINLWILAPFIQVIDCPSPPKNDDCINGTVINQVPFAASDSVGPYARESEDLSDCPLRESQVESYRGVWFTLLGDGLCYLAHTTQGDYSIDVYEGNCTDLYCTAQSFSNETAFATHEGVIYHLLVSDSNRLGYGLPLESNYAMEVSVGFVKVKVSKAWTMANFFPFFFCQKEISCDLIASNQDCNSAISIEDNLFQANTSFMFNFVPIDGFRNCSTITGFETGLFYSLVGNGQLHVVSPASDSSSFIFAVMIGGCDSLECVSESFFDPLIFPTDAGVTYTIFVAPIFDFLPVDMAFTVEVGIFVEVNLLYSCVLLSSLRPPRISYV